MTGGADTKHLPTDLNRRAVVRPPTQQRLGSAVASDVRLRSNLELAVSLSRMGLQPASAKACGPKQRHAVAQG